MKITYLIVFLCTMAGAFMIASLITLTNYNNWDSMTITVLLAATTVIISSLLVSISVVLKDNNEHQKSLANDTISLLVRTEDSYRVELMKLSKELSGLQKVISEAQTKGIPQDINKVISEAFSNASADSNRREKLVNEIKNLVNQQICIL